MLKNKTGYFWDFYKWQILAVLTVAAMGIYFLCAALAKKECILSVMLLDCHTDTSQQEMEKDLLLAMPSAEKNQAVSVQKDLMLSDAGSGTFAVTSLSRFLADVGSESLDVCGMLEADFIKYDEAGTFLDLRDVMDEEWLLRHEEDLFATKGGRTTGIYADALPGLQKYGCYAPEGSRGIIGIVYNTKRQEMAAWYLAEMAGEEFPFYEN